MPPKNNQKSSNTKSKEEKRLEQYLNHPANLSSSENQNKQANKKGGKNNSKGASSEQQQQQQTQNDTENQIVQLLKEVDINKPLPDFSALDNSISTLRKTLEEMDSLIVNISTNNTQALGAPPTEEEESGFKTANLTPDIIQKRDQIIKDVKKTIEVYQQKQSRVNELATKENMADIKDQLLVLSANLTEDIKSKEQILSIF